MGKFRKTLNLIMLVVLIASNFLTPISYATADLESGEDTSQIVDASENVGDTYDITGGGDSLTNLENDAEEEKSSLDAPEGEQKDSTQEGDTQEDTEKTVEDSTDEKAKTDGKNTVLDPSLNFHGEEEPTPSSPFPEGEESENLEQNSQEKTADNSADEKAKTETNDTVLDNSFQTVGEGEDILTSPSSLEGEDDNLEQDIPGDSKKTPLEEAWETKNIIPIEGNGISEDVTVEVRAESGTFPDGTYLDIQPVTENLNEIKKAITDDDKAQIVAFDIKFLLDLDGDTIKVQPDTGKKVQVKFDYPQDKEFNNSKVYHIEKIVNNDNEKKGGSEEKGDGGKKGMKGGDEDTKAQWQYENVKIKTTETKKSANSLVVDATKFSIYAIIKTNIPESVTVHYNAGDGAFTGNVSNVDIIYTLSNGEYIADKATQQPNQDGYSFRGWYTSNSCTTRWNGIVDDTTTPEVTVYACYLPFSDITKTFGRFSFTMMDRNLGATSTTNYGYLYQWGNNYGFEDGETPAVSEDLVATNTYNSQPWGPEDYYSSSNFISRQNSPFRWDNADIRNLWGGTSDSQTDWQGPCPDGYHVPNSAEWVAVYESYIASGNLSKDFGTNLGLPMAGYRNNYGAGVTDAGNQGRYWASNALDGDSAYALTFTTSSATANDTKYRTYGNSVRCFKNTDKVNITFNSNGGSTVTGQTFDWYEARTQSLKPVPTKTEENFAGWYYDSELTQIFNWADNKYVTEDTTLYAKWGCEPGYVLNSSNECVLRQVTVTYKKGNSTRATATYVRNTDGYYMSTTQVQPPKESGYMFDQWYLDSGFTQLWKYPEDNDGLGENITVYAKFLPFEDKTVDLGDISLVLMDRNLGAVDTSEGYGDATADNIGYYYQFGNNYGFPNAGVWTNTYVGSIRNIGSTLSQSNMYSNGLFEKGGQQYFIVGQSYNNVWGGYSANANVDSNKVGPCPDGYHIPETTEWSATFNKFKTWKASAEGTTYCGSLGTGECFAKALGLPFGGQRLGTTSDIDGQGTAGYYWASSYVNLTSSTKLTLSSSNFSTSNVTWTNALNLRCFKNTDQYTLTFNSMGGSDVVAQKIWWWKPYSTATPTRVGSVFSGWYLDTGYENKFDGTVSANTTVYAKWECSNGYQMDSEGNCVKDTYISVKYVANPSTFPGGKFPGGESQKTIEYRLTVGGYFAAHEEIQVPNLAGNYMFEGWYTDTSYTPASRWTGLNSTTTYSEITLYARYLPFNDKTVDFGGVSITIMDRNLGALDYSSGYSYNNSESTAYGSDNVRTKIGNYYQWGNNFGFPNRTYSGSANGTTDAYPNSDTTTRVVNYGDTAWGPGNYYFNGKFIRRPDSPYRWDDADNANLWGGVTNTDESKQGPCPDGYHVPHTNEWLATRNVFNNWSATQAGATYCNSIHATNTGIQFCMPAVLGLPFAGYRKYSSAGVISQGTDGFYWSSSRYNALNAYRLSFYSSALNPQNNSSRAYGFSVRCFKNSPSLTLTFDSNGGSSVASQTNFKWWSPRSSKPANPTRAKSTFKGWFLDDGTFAEEFTFSSTTYVSENKTLHAKWECDDGYSMSEDGQKCESVPVVTFNATANGGSTSRPIASFREGATVHLEEYTATKPGWDFVGWNTNQTAKTAMDNFVIGEDGVRLYAIFKRDLVATFDINGNDSLTLNSNTVTTNITGSCAVWNKETSCSVKAPYITSANTPRVLGYSDSSTNHVGTYAVNSNISISGDTTFYAQTIKDPLDRLVTFNPNGNTNFTYDGDTQTSAKDYVLCTIPAVYNGAVQSDSCTETITFPDITPSGQKTVLGWSTGANITDNLISTGSSQTLTATKNLTYYAQSQSDGKTLTVTFYGNGATISGANSWQTTCSIAPEFNGGVQATQCDVDVPSESTVSRAGFSIYGYDINENVHSATYPTSTNKITVSADTSFYVISNKQLSVRFYKNGNDAQTQNGQSIANTSEYVSENCYVRNNSTSCNVTTPSISSVNTPTILGYSTSASNHVAVVGQNSLLSISDETPYYAQSKKESKSINISFYVNGNQGYNYSGTDYTEDSTHALCTIEEVYNGTEQSPTCNKSITFPTITAPDNTPTVLGWTDGNDNHTAQYTAGQTATVTAGENLNFFAQTTSPAIVLRGTFSTGAGVQSIAYNSGTCTISAIYNGNDGKAQKESCSIVFPTFELKQGYENPVWRSSLGDQNANTTLSLPITANTSFTLIGDTAFYTITYDKLGGILTDEKTSYTVEDDDFTLKTPTKRGYEFLGWTGSNGNTPQKTVVVHKGTHGNLSYTANWRLATYTITYHLYNGTVNGTNPVEYTVETELFTLTDPSKVGHTFAGWTGTNLSSPTTPVSVRKGTVGDLEFFANYTKNLYEVTLTYTPSTGGSVDGAGTYEYGENITVTANPDTGYHFVSWLDDEDNVVSTNNPYVFTADETGGTGLKAVFELNEYDITVSSSDENKGTVNSEVSGTYKYGKRITLIATAKQGYRFDRWTKNNTTISTNTTVEVDVTEAMNITGHFVARDDTPYTVKHWKQNINDNDYTVAEEQPLSGTTDTQTSATSKPYEGFTPQTITQLPINADGNTVVNVYYTRNSYDVVYNFSNTPDGHSVLPATQSHKYGKTVSVAGLATAPGYTFSWNTGSSFTMPAHAVVITGTFTAKENTPYTIEYYYQKSDGTYPTTPNFTGQRVGTTDTETGVIASDQIPDISMENYVYDATNSDNITTTTIKGDESGLLKIYFKKQYTVEYNPGTKGTFTGEVINGLDYNANTPSPTVDTGLHQEGYTFNGWSPAILPKVTENKTYTAQWIANEYVVNFDNNGGSGSMETESMTYDDSKALSENAFTKAGYTFLGWDVDSDATTPTYTGGEIVSNLASNSGEVVTLYAIWDANTDTPYTVYYYLENADNDNYSLNSTDDTKVGTTDSEVLISTLEKEITGAHFEKASLVVNPQSTEDLIDKFTIDGNGNTEVYLFYKRNTHTVTATTGEGVGSVSGAGTYKYGATVTLTPEDINPCYTATDITFIMPDSNVEKVLSGTIKSFTVTLEKDSNTNSVQGAGTYNCGDEVTVTATPKSGYSFARWNSEDVASSTSNPYTFTMPDKAVSIQAQSNANTYTVNFNANGGIGVMTPQEFTYDISQQLSNNLFTKTGYIFTGWSMNSGATAPTYTNMQNVDNLATSGSVTLYAVWTTKGTNTKYTVRHIKQGLSTPTDDVIVEEELYAETNSVQTPAVNTYPGFNSPSSDTLIVAPNGNASIDYVYTRKDITLTLNNNNGTPNTTITGKYGAEVQKPTTNPTKNGYTFVSWTPSIPDNFPATNEIYIAQYTLDTYTINYNLNGGTNHSDNPESYTYLSGEITLKAPSRDGYVFNGWTGTEIDGTSKNVTIPTHSVGNRNYTAIWGEDKNNNGVDDETEDKYTVTYTDGVGGAVFENQTTENILSGLTTPAFSGTPERTNYIFGGWNPSVSNIVAGDVTYTAIWNEDFNHDGQDDATETKYEVKFVAGEHGSLGGTTIYSGILSGYTLNDVVGYVEPSKNPDTNYIFAGWTPSLNVNAKITSNVVYTGVFAEDFNHNGINDTTESHFTVTYTDGVDGQVVFADQITSNILSGLVTPSFNGSTGRDNYIFAGWAPSVADKVTGDAIYTATWKVDSNNNGVADENETYTLTINYVYSKGGTAAISHVESVLSGAEYSVTSPSVTNYQTIDTLVSGIMPGENKTITVTYTPITDDNHNDIADQEEPKYTLTIQYHDAKGGTVYSDYTHQYVAGASYEKISQTKEYYTITSGATVSGVMPANNITVTVIYTANLDVNDNGIADQNETHYTLTIHYVNTQGGTLYPDYTGSYVAGAEYNIPSDTSNTHYTIESGKETVIGIMPAQNTVIAVTYTANTDDNGNGIADEDEASDFHSLTIHYVNSKGVTVFADYTQSIVKGASYTVNSPTKAHYTISIPIVSGTMGDEDIEVTVIYNTESEDTNDNGIADEDETAHVLTIIYRYSRGEQASQSVTASYLSGISYSVTSPIIANYTADKLTVSGIMGDTSKTIIVTYTPDVDDNNNGVADILDPKYTATVHYVYSRGGVAHADKTQQDILSGLVYNISSPVISHYTPSEQTISGTITGANVEFTVTYTPETDENHDGYADEDEIKYTVIYTDGVDGEVVFANQTTEDILSGTTTPAFSGTPTRVNYIFAGWTPAVAEKVTANATYTATWKEDMNNNGIDDATETKYTITVNYVYSRGGEASPSVSGKYLSGISFIFISPNIPNYTPNSGMINGTGIEAEQMFTVTYRPNTDTNGNGVADEEENLNPGGSGGSSSSYSGSGRRVAKSVNNIQNHGVSEENKEQNGDNASVENNENQGDTTQNLGNKTKDKPAVVITENNRKMYSEEVIDAYTWAYANDITTINSFEKATPNKVMIRGHMAKVVVNYMVNVLGKEIPKDIPANCKWNDNEKDWGSEEMKDYGEKACALGIMGINTKRFQPKKTVSRAEFGTILSRILWGDKYNIDNPTKDKPYYINHLKSLKENGIMKQIDNPRRDELREWIWVMLRRTTKK